MWCKHLWNSFVYCASFPHHNNAAVHCCMIYLSATSIVLAVFIGKHPRWDNYSLWRQSAIWFISTSENYPIGRRYFLARATYCATKKGYFVFSFPFFLSFPVPQNVWQLLTRCANFLATPHQLFSDIRSLCSLFVTVPLPYVPLKFSANFKVLP